VDVDLDGETLTRTGALLPTSQDLTGHQEGDDEEHGQ
jgi:hypothetical protein